MSTESASSPNENPTDVLFHELLSLAESLGIEVEVGDVPGDGGLVRLGGRSRILLNARSPQTHRVDVLVQALAQQDLSGQFLKPRVRELLESVTED